MCRTILGSLSDLNPCLEGVVWRRMAMPPEEAWRRGESRPRERRCRRV